MFPERAMVRERMRNKIVISIYLNIHLHVDISVLFYKGANTQTGNYNLMAKELQQMTYGV